MDKRVLGALLAAILTCASGRALALQAETGATCVVDPVTNGCKFRSADCRVGGVTGDCTTKTFQVFVTVKTVCQCVAPPPPEGGSQSTEVKWDPTSPFVIPAPGGTIDVDYELDTAYSGLLALTKLGSSFGSLDVHADVLAGSLSVHGMRRSTPGEEHIVDLVLNSASIMAESVTLPGLGSTGPNVLTYDMLTGTLDLNDGSLSMSGQARITNNWFPPSNPILSQTQQDGLVDLPTGTFVIVTSAVDVIPALPDPWTDLGSGLAGIAGVPSLVGTGSLLPGTSGTLTLSSAAPFAPCLLFVSVFSTPVPFKCGVLVPVPILTNFLLVTGPSGSIAGGWPGWSSGLSGLSLFVQYAVLDAAAACGVSLSNALRADVP